MIGRILCRIGWHQETVTSRFTCRGKWVEFWRCTRCRRGHEQAPS